MYLTPTGSRRAPSPELFARVCPGLHMEGARVGSYCKVQDMVARADMNACTCRLEEYVAATGRWRVSMRRCIPLVAGSGGWWGSGENTVPRDWSAGQLHYWKIRPDNLMLLLRRNIPVVLHSLVRDTQFNQTLGFLTEIKTSGDCEVFLHGDVGSFSETEEAVVANGERPWPKVTVSPRNVAPTLYIGCRVRVVTPHAPFHHRREAFILGYDTCTRDWNVWVMAGRKMLSGWVLADKYAVPCCRPGETATLDLDHGPRSSTTAPARGPRFGASGQLVSADDDDVGAWNVRVSKKDTRRAAGLHPGHAHTQTTVLSLDSSEFVTTAEARNMEAATHDLAHVAWGAPSFGKLQMIVTSPSYTAAPSTDLH